MHSRCGNAGSWKNPKVLLKGGLLMRNVSGTAGYDANDVSAKTSATKNYDERKFHACRSLRDLTE
jgi:hypothetical protein